MLSTIHNVRTAKYRDSLYLAVENNEYRESHEFILSQTMYIWRMYLSTLEIDYLLLLLKSSKYVDMTSRRNPSKFYLVFIFGLGGHPYLVVDTSN